MRKNLILTKLRNNYDTSQAYLSDTRIHLSCIILFFRSLVKFRLNINDFLYFVKVNCFGGTTGAINLTVTGGTSPYTFLWSNEAVTEDISNLAPGNYTVTITDANGCTASAVGNVTQPAAALTGTTVVTNILCSGESTGAVNLTVSGGVSPYTFLWSNGATTEDISGLTAGSYAVTVTDANGCKVNPVSTVTEPSPLTLAEIHTNASCPDVRDGSITLAVSGGTQPYFVLWSDGITSLTRSATDSTYSVVVTDVNLCTASLNVEVVFDQSSACLQIPKVITPNGDGKNDTWVIKNIGILYPNAELLIFNRWDKLVYRTKNVELNPWDAKENGKLVPTDSYHYILYLNDRSRDTKTGVITVVR